MSYDYGRRVELARQKLDALGIDPGDGNPYSIYRGLSPEVRASATRGAAAVRTGTTPRQAAAQALQAGRGDRRQRFDLGPAGQLMRTTTRADGTAGNVGAVQRFAQNHDGPVEITWTKAGRSGPVSVTEYFDEWPDDGDIYEAGDDAFDDVYSSGAWGGGFTSIQVRAM